jgi:hypothetical protein
MSTSVNDLIKEVLSGQYSVEEKTDLIDEIRKARPPLADRWLYRWVVWFLGAAVVLTLGLGIWVISNQTEPTVPSGLLALGSAAVGALAGLISPSTQSDN